MIFCLFAFALESYVLVLGLILELMGQYEVPEIKLGSAMHKVSDLPHYIISLKTPSVSPIPTLFGFWFIPVILRRPFVVPGKELESTSCKARAAQTVLSLKSPNIFK